MMKHFTALIPYLSVVAQYPTTEKDTLRALNEIVVSASRTPEALVKSPISIEYLDKRTILYSAQIFCFDALENVKELHLMTSSMGISGIGFIALDYIIYAFFSGISIFNLLVIIFSCKIRFYYALPVY